MSNDTITHDGQELKFGEYRQPRLGEYYLAHGDALFSGVFRAGDHGIAQRLDGGRRQILEPVIPPVPNDGKPAKGPNGDWYEFTGEYRARKAGDLVWSLTGYGWTPYECLYASANKYFIMRKVEKPEAPKGYEHTDEYRTPVVGETYINMYNDDLASLRESEWNFRTGNTDRWILRKVEPLPVWYHEGTRVYKREQGGYGRGGWDNAQFDARMEHDAKHAVYLLNEAASE